MRAHVPSRVRLMADFGADPVWDASPGEGGMLRLEDLPLSPSLRAELRAWAREFDLHESATKPWLDRAAWVERGRVLANKVDAELPSTTVAYDEDSLPA